VTNPLRLIDAALTRSAQRILRREKSLVVDGDQASRILLLRGALRFAISVAAIFGSVWLPDPWDAVGTMALGGLVGASALITFQRASAYRTGWLDGRSKMLEGIKNSDSPDHWINHELSYDVVHVMGLPLPFDTPDSPEGLED
jgi:hypothetical protein